MCCGSVPPKISVEVISQLSYRIFLGKGFRISSLLIVREGLPLSLAVSCGRKTLPPSLSLVRGTFCVFGLYDNPNVQQSLSQSASGVLPGANTG